MTSATTIISFLSMCFMDVYAIANLGLVMVFSTMISTTFFFTSLIPAYVLLGGLERFRGLTSKEDEDYVLLSSLLCIPATLADVVSRCGGQSSGNEPSNVRPGDDAAAKAVNKNTPSLSQRLIVTAALAALLVLDVGLMVQVSLGLSISLVSRSPPFSPSHANQPTHSCHLCALAST